MTTTNETAAAAPPASDPAAAAAAAPAPGAATPSAAEAQGSLLEPAAAPAAGATGDDWLPEKFRVAKEDGTIDEAASARKLAESYKALEAHKGPMPAVPATPEDYKLAAPKDAEGKPMLDDEGFAAFTADPMFQGFAKDAHAAGLTNEQLQFVTDRYLNLAPKLIAADQAISLEEARAELKTLWADDKTMADNLAGVTRAIQAFGAEADDVPGSRTRLMEKYGRDPDFIAFAATVAGEIKEDRLPASSPMTSEADVEALQRGPAYWDKNHPDHARVVGQVNTFYARKYGTAKR